MPKAEQGRNIRFKKYNFLFYRKSYGVSDIFLHLCKTMCKTNYFGTNIA